VVWTVGASASTLLNIDFDSKAGSWSKTGGSWSITSDGSKVLQQSNGGSGGARQFGGSSSWTTYSLQARVKALSLPQTGSAATVLAHATGSTSFDRVAVLGSGKAQLQSVRSGRVTVLGTISLSRATGAWHAVRLQESGSTVSGWVDGQLVGTGASQSGHGRIGLQTLSGTANFDDVKVESSVTPVPPPITTPQAAPTTTPTTTAPTTAPGPTMPSSTTSPPDGGGSSAEVSGYATVGGSTAGGSGPVVTVTSASALASAAGQSGGPSIIRVNGSLTCSGDIAMRSNTTIVGVGADSGLTGCGLSMKGVSNVIVRNMKIAKVQTSSGTGDAIHIENSHHIWIDHNDLSSDRSSGKDYYDGLIDITHVSDYVTVSWNYLHDHYKSMLVGHSDDNAAQDTGKLHITYHHNYGKNINSRTPSLRFGTGHVYNNYFVTGDTGVHSRMGARLLVENNVFSGVKIPIQTDVSSSQAGYVSHSGNDFGTGTNKITQTGSFTDVPYDYTLDPTSSVAGLVTAGAGTGHVS
jgi:pectate lyase